LFRRPLWLSPTRMAAGVAGRTRSRRDSLRCDAVRVTVWLGPGWPTARDPPGSSVARATCGPTCARKTPWGFGRGQQLFDESPQGRGGAAKGSPAMRVNNRDPSQASTRPDGTQGSPRQGESKTFGRAPAHDVEAARRGWWRGGAFTLARVHGATQPLGGYAHEPGEAQALQRSGLYPIARPRSATRPWRCSGWRSRQREEARRGGFGRRRPRARPWTVAGSREEPQRLRLYPRARVHYGNRAAKPRWRGERTRRLPAYG
jgi:hypothetical protein